MIRLMRRCWNSAKLRGVWVICRIFPVNKKKITISSFYGRGYGDNAKYIVEKLLASEKKFRIVWLVNNEEEKKTLPRGVEACNINTFQCVYHLMTSKIWIDNCRKFFIMLKRKKQFYIQTWHGFALKRIEKDAITKLADDYEKIARRDSKNIDCVISCSSFMTNIYRNAFWYDGDIIEIGAPRNDILLRDCCQAREKVCQYFGLDISKKIVLYAPTFRADRKMEAYAINYDRIREACNKRFGGEFVFITRMHPNIAVQSQDLKWSDNVINGSFYPDMQELMATADVMITDYSSVMFDYALTGKPCFQFATDIDEYKNDRDFYFELDRLPFMVSTNNQELERDILVFDEEKYKIKLKSFYENVGMIRDGNASEKCAEFIIEKCYGGRSKKK